mmetsp:Transcript_67497/g.141080  ORF Transcript_67497/g.141080 Transcript_67497/m.141080 type:complete len:82 (-) Transcript_67497:129-374(-)
MSSRTQKVVLTAWTTSCAGEEEPMSCVLAALDDWDMHGLVLVSSTIWARRLLGGLCALKTDKLWILQTPLPKRMSKSSCHT